MSDAAAEIPAISCDEVAQHVERGDIFLLDVRRSAHGKQIYGAIQYDPKKLENAGRLVLPLPKSEGLIVIYDDDGTAARTRELGEKLIAGGYAGVHVLEGGYAAWQAADGRTEDVTLEQPVPTVSEQQLER